LGLADCRSLAIRFSSKKPFPLAGEVDATALRSVDARRPCSVAWVIANRGITLTAIGCRRCGILRAQRNTARTRCGAEFFLDLPCGTNDWRPRFNVMERIKNAATRTQIGAVLFVMERRTLGNSRRWHWFAWSKLSV
jgi:hypothetical protein